MFGGKVGTPDMRQDEALYNFFASFNIPAYATTAVPEDAVYPWLTYDLITGSWEDVNSITVNLWYYGTSEAEANQKVEEISHAIGLGGKLILCDGGALWLKRGSPWCQSVKDADNMVKRRYINVDVEFLVT